MGLARAFGKGGRKSARLCVYIRLGEHWEGKKAFRRAYRGALRQPTSLELSGYVPFTVCVHGDVIKLF